MTGTPEFFDSRRGVAGLPPLHDRIQFTSFGGMASLKQPQLDLSPFDKPRLQEVAFKLRELHPGGEVVRQKITDAFILRLIEQVTEGFGGDVGVVPRQFLRALVMHMDLVVQEPSYAPMAVAGFTPTDPTAAEQARLSPAPPAAEDDADLDLMPVEDVW